MSHDVSRPTPGIGFFACFVFVLTAVPKVSVRIGPVPLYLIDLMVAVLLIFAFRAPVFRTGPRPFRGIVLTLFAIAIFSELGSMALSGAIVEPVYLMGRITLSFLVFYITGQLVRGPDDLKIVLKAAALGLIVTALLMISTSLPMTRSFVAETILSNRLLEPAAENASLRYIDTGDSGVRGRTLVGVSIMGATYLNILWPLAALLYSWPGGAGTWRRIALAACFLAPMGVLMSYSRGPILGSILILLAVLVLGVGRIRRGILLPLAAGTALILAVGVNSEIFFFERLTNRTSAMLDAPLDDERESERLLAYVEPFKHVMEHPRFWILGEGTGIGRTEAEAEQAGMATHALFAKAYYSNGMVAAFLYMILLFNAVYLAFWHLRHRGGTIGAYYAQALALAVIGLLPWAVFGHAIVSAPRGAMMFFFLLGLLTTLRHFPHRAPAPQVIERDPAHVQGHRAAV